MSAKDLLKYDEYREAVEVLRNSTYTRQEFSIQLKNDQSLKSLRNAARNELQSIYDEVRQDLELPIVSVFLPRRMKVRTRGQAHAVGSNPTEIRVYPIEGPVGIPYQNWRPQHVTICTKFVAFEIFKHEVAHVISTHRNGRMDNHDETFVAAYDEINEYFKSHGFEPLIDKSLELWGVPPTSYAAMIAISRDSGRTSAQEPSRAGCLTFALMSALIVITTILEKF